MNTTYRPRWLRVARALTRLLWIAIAILLLQQACAPAQRAAARADLLDQFQQARTSRVIALIHRQETVSLFGVPVSSYIDIEDSEAVLRAIRLTPPDQPIDLILHTPGGLVLAAEQIAHALVERTGKVTVFVPHYAMSGGTLIALTADEIVMDPNAVLGPVDPQIGDMPAASIANVLTMKTPDRVSDEMLVLADVSMKARRQVASFVNEVLLKHLPHDKARNLAVVLSEGRWTHDFPITVAAARQLGLPVSTDMPPTIYELMDLYPQSGVGRPSVLYAPSATGPNEQISQNRPILQIGRGEDSVGGLSLPSCHLSQWPLSTWGNGDLLQRVLLNLLTNAIEAIEGPGVIQIRARAESEPGAADASIHIDIADDGVGIPAALIGRVFDRGFSSKAAGVLRGLGLAICREIVRMHGGRLELSSQPGAGTTAHLSLPAHAQTSGFPVQAEPHLP